MFNQYNLKFYGCSFEKKTYIYRISSYSCRDNCYFSEVGVWQVFKGGNYSKEETIAFLLFVKKEDINRSRNLDQAN